MREDCAEETLACRPSGGSRSIHDHARAPEAHFTTASPALRYRSLQMRSSGSHLPEVSAGVVLARSYRVLAVLAVGSGTIVLDTEHTSSGQRYAVKVYDPALVLQHPGGLEAFMQTARRLTRVSGPNTIRVVAVGVLESGAPYLALEYVVGVDLCRVLREAGSLAPLEVAQYMVQVCESLEQAHALGMVHREVRPSNMFIVEPSPGARVLKLANYSVGTIIDGPTVSGADDRASVEYSAPEILRGAPIDARADVWALGVTFFELVSGRRPWSSAELGRLLETRQAIAPPRLERSDRAPLSPKYSEWVRRCLVESPDGRFANAGEAKLALLQLMQPEGGSIHEPWSEEATRVDGRRLGVADTEVASAPPSSVRASMFRPAFAEARPQGPLGAVSDATTVLPNKADFLPQAPFTEQQLPTFVIKPASSTGRNLALGGLALALIVALPLAYVYQRGRQTAEPPEVTAAEVLPPPAPSMVDVTTRVEHQRVTSAPSSGPQRFFVVPPPQQQTRKR
jgi:serine/threonine protein kinase